MTTVRIISFPPLVSHECSSLILGTMPSAASLAAREYYAHRQNLFWTFVEELFAIPRSQPYAQRCARLNGAGVAVWDVLKACVRPGSLDSQIDMESIVTNDLPEFFAEYPRITHIYFNGAKAEQIFLRHVASDLKDLVHSPKQVRLPSTSPANASIPRAEKLAAWRTITESVRDGLGARRDS